MPKPPPMSSGRPRTRCRPSPTPPRTGWGRWPRAPPTGSARWPRARPTGSRRWPARPSSGSTRTPSRPRTGVSPYTADRRRLRPGRRREGRPDRQPAPSCAEPRSPRTPVRGSARCWTMPLDRVSPAVAAARDKVSDRPAAPAERGLSAAAASPAVEEVSTGRGDPRAARASDLPKKKKSRWVKRLAVDRRAGRRRGGRGPRVLRQQGRRLAGRPAERPVRATDPARDPDATAASPTRRPAPGPPRRGRQPRSRRRPPAETAHRRTLEANDEAVPDQPAEGGDGARRDVGG